MAISCDPQQLMRSCSPQIAEDGSTQEVSCRSINTACSPVAWPKIVHPISGNDEYRREQNTKCFYSIGIRPSRTEHRPEKIALESFRQRSKYRWNHLQPAQIQFGRTPARLVEKSICAPFRTTTGLVLVQSNYHELACTAPWGVELPPRTLMLNVIWGQELRSRSCKAKSNSRWR